MSNKVKQISTREFIKTLEHHDFNLFVQATNPDLETLETSMETTLGIYPVKTDSVKRAGITNLLLNSGNVVELTGKGKREYYKFVNSAGIEFVMQKSISRDELCDELDMDRIDYSVYAIAA